MNTNPTLLEKLKSMFFTKQLVLDCDNEYLLEVCEKTGLTPKQAVASALAILSLLADLNEGGAKVIVRHEDGEEEELDALRLDQPHPEQD